MRARLMALVVIAGVFSLDVQSADAYVRGGRWTGSFTNSFDQTASLAIDFRLDGTLTWTRDFGDGPVPFTGTYREYDFYIISFWSGTVDNSLNIDGISVINLFSSLNGAGVESPLTLTGKLTRSGQAQPPATKTDHSKSAFSK